MAVGTNFTAFLTGKDALILFYGIYMTAIISLIKKYRIFDLYLFLSKNITKKVHARRRFIIGFLLIDLIPIAWFWILYRFIIPEIPGAFPIMAAAFASFSIFGFERILHSIVATQYHQKFYTGEEFEVVLKEWGKKNDEDNNFKIHFISGLIYLIIFPAIAFFIGRLPFP